MILIRVGRRRLNLEYVIEDEEGDGSPETPDIPIGAIRVVMERGREFVLTGEDADSYRRQVEAHVLRDPVGDAPAGPFDSSVGHLAPRPVDPQGGGHAVREAGGKRRPEGG